MDLITKELQKAYVRKHAKAALARSSFYDYCKLVDPDGYNDTCGSYLEEYCDVLGNFYDGLLLKPDGLPYKKLMINIPPQHLKTRTMVHFCAYALGRNRQERIITASYNDRTAYDFSKYTRDEITRSKIDPEATVFRDIFPTSQLKRGSAALERWALEGEHFNYLGAGIGGSITSKGATILVIDDPVKGALEAMNAGLLDKIWIWYSGTFISRVSAVGGEPLEIVLMTRWAKGDICGCILDSNDKDNWFVFKKEAYDEKTGLMLDPKRLAKPRYEHLKRTQPMHIFMPNYHQKPIDMVNALYDKFKIYDELPLDPKGKSLFSAVKAYVDTADTGSDFLCAIIYGIHLGYAYVLDVYYTDASMEITEPETAKHLHEFGCQICKVESNNGGRGFSRNLKRLLWDTHKVRVPAITWFHQSQNKRARILTQHTNVTNLLLFPAGWENKWPEFAVAMKTYQKNKINVHDDAPDCATGVVEELVGTTGNVIVVDNIL